MAEPNMSEINEQMSGMTTGIVNALCSKEVCDKIASAVALFYKRLTEEGVPSDDAYMFANSYMDIIKENIIKS